MQAWVEGQHGVMVRQVPAAAQSILNDILEGDLWQPTVRKCILLTLEGNKWQHMSS
jgi:hypothetical protein